MKIFLLLATFSVTQLCASTASSQNVKLGKNELTVREAFKEIERQTQYNFLYNSDFSGMHKKIRFNETETDIYSMLGNILGSTDLTYRIIDDNLVVIIPAKQDKNMVSGRVTSSEDRLSIPGVTVHVKGTDRGTVTDADGRFTIEAGANDILVFSFVGMTSVEAVIDGRNWISVELKPQISRLDEVVVLGYGTSKVRDVTGAIARVSEADLVKAPMGSTVQSLLQGRAAGVNVMIQSASPTSPISVVIRGQSSLTGNNQPLWVIDGVPEYSAGTSGNIANTLYNLNINDVESIDILKDASATALYGSRAAHGVVIVTTKSGRENLAPVIEFSSRFGLQQMNFNGYSYFEAPEYIQWADYTSKLSVVAAGGFDYFTRLYVDEQAWMNKNNSEFDVHDLVTLPGAYYDGNTNWLKEMTHNPWSRQMDLSLRGGTPNTSYFISLYNNWQDGIVKTGSSETYGGRLRLESRVGKDLRFGANVSGSSRNTNDKDYMLTVLKRVRPDIPAFEQDGSIFTRDAYTENPYTTLKNTLTGNGVQFNGTGNLEYNIINGLVAKTAYTMNYTDGENLTYRWRGSTFNYDGARQWSTYNTPTMVWENTLNFARTFGKHDIIALAGYSREKTRTTTYGMNASNFPDDEVLNNFNAGATKGNMTETVQAHALISQFARAHYKFNNKYIISGTIRRDGSSRFGPDKRWGIFPSVAGAWLITEEGFLKNPEIRKYITYLKLRASTGRAGSQNLSNYAWRTNVGASRYDDNPAIVPSSIGNAELRWEQATMTDLGMDFGLWNERIRGSFGVYRRKTDDLIYSNPLPPSSAFASISSNIASTQNEGVEFEIKYDAIHSKDLLLTLDFNTASNVTKVLKINNVLQELFFGGVMKLEAGQRTGQWFGYQWAGRFFVNQEDVIAHQSQQATGAVQFYRNSMELFGDLVIVDQNGDGTITTDDRVYLGSSEPKMFGGFGATLMYKNLMINGVFTYAYGHLRLWQMPRDDVGYGGNYNHSAMIAGRSPDMVGPYEAAYPRLRAGYGRGGNEVITDFWLHDASFIRLNALNVSYRLPDKYFKDILVNSLELTFQATNLFTITKYPGFDPQGNWSSTSIGNGMGLDGSNYPASRIFNFGIKATFN